MSAEYTMDTPLRAILSELLPVFGLSPIDICALLCTCREALTREIPRPRLSDLGPLVSLCDDTAGVDYVMVEGPFLALVLSREQLYVALLSRRHFTYLKFKRVFKCGADRWRLKQQKISKILDAEFGQHHCFADDVAAGAELTHIHTYAGGKFYKLPRNFRKWSSAKEKKLLKKYLLRVTAVEV